MADVIGITASDRLVYTAVDSTGGDVNDGPTDKRIEEGSGLRVQSFKLSMQTNKDGYPTGGIPLEKEFLGCPNRVVDLRLVEEDAALGYAMKIDKSALKIKLYLTKDPGDAGGADVQLQEVANATQLSAFDELIVEAKGY